MTKLFVLWALSICASCRGVGAFLPSLPGPQADKNIGQSQYNDHHRPIASRQDPERSSSTFLPPSTEGNASVPEILFKSFLSGLWKGITWPFPVLRKIVGEAKADASMGITLGVRTGFLFLVSYLAVGVAAYSYLFETWSIVDSLYFSAVCFSTVGYGDLCPSTAAGRLFTCLFGLCGIAFLGTAVATICSSVVQAEKDAAKQIEELTNKRILSLFQDMPNKLKELRNKSPKKESNSMTHHTTQEERSTSNNRDIESKGGSVLSAVQQYLPSLSVILSGGFIIGRLDGWNILESIYYSIITASTVGFGDFSPKSRAARLCAIVFIPLSVAAAGEILSKAATVLVERRQRKAYQRQVGGDLRLEHLTAMDADESGHVSREEYVYFMLKEMGFVSQDALNELIQQFDKLDVTKSGYLDQEDLILMAEMRGARVEK